MGEKERENESRETGSCSWNGRLRKAEGTERVPASTEDGVGEKEREESKSYPWEIRECLAVQKICEKAWEERREERLMKGSPGGRRSRLRDLAAGGILQTRRILEGEKTYQV